MLEIWNIFSYFMIMLWSYVLVDIAYDKYDLTYVRKNIMYGVWGVGLIMWVWNFLYSAYRLGMI